MHYFWLFFLLFRIRIQLTISCDLCTTKRFKRHSKRSPDFESSKEFQKISLSIWIHRWKVEIRHRKEEMRDRMKKLVLTFRYFWWFFLGENWFIARRRRCRIWFLWWDGFLQNLGLHIYITWIWNSDWSILYFSLQIWRSTYLWFFWWCEIFIWFPARIVRKYLRN